MKEISSLYYFFEKLEIARDKISLSAKRSGLSADSAILLAIIYLFPEINLPISEDVVKQLIIKGLISGEKVYRVTGKGAILAKSFSEILKSV